MLEVEQIEGVDGHLDGGGGGSYYQKIDQISGRSDPS
jgi:hypothetical protein